MITGRATPYSSLRWEKDALYLRIEYEGSGKAVTGGGLLSSGGAENAGREIHFSNIRGPGTLGKNGTQNSTIIDNFSPIRKVGAVLRERGKIGGLIDFQSLPHYTI